MTTTPDLPDVDHAARRARAVASLSTHEVDALLVTSLVNVRYLTGFTGSNGQLVLSGAGATLITDGRYRDQAAAQTDGVDIAIDRSSASRVVSLATDLGAAQVGVEADALTLAALSSLEDESDAAVTFVPTRGVIEALRAVKDAHELAALTRACELTDQAFSALLEIVRPGMTEREVGRFLDRTMEDLGASAPSFETIAAIGPNSAIPHHRPTDAILLSGQLLKLDFGALAHGYHADMTRTISFGEPDAELRTIHALVQESQAAGRAVAVEGASTAAVDTACRDLIEAAGYGEAFVHGTGHGVGLEIHEAPWVGKGTAGTLHAATPITVEPGIYVPGLGGVRIEDTIVIAAGGSPATSLTTSPRELVVL